MSKSSIICYLIGILLIKICASDFRKHPNWPKHLDQFCGESNDVRISGGKMATLGQFPW